MPQMAPMMWLILFLLFILTFFLFNILNYYNFLKFNKNLIKENMNFNKNKTIILNWKW